MSRPAPFHRLGAAARRAWRIVSFLGWYAGHLLQANYVIAREIVTPGSGLAPTVVAWPVHERGPWEIASLSSLLTLTPGTMVLGLTPDRHRLLVHGMHAADPAAFREEVRELDLRLQAAFRPVGGPRSPDDDPVRR